MKDVSVKYTKTGVPFVIVDDFFNGFESEQLLAELEFVRPHLSGSGETGGAVSLVDGSNLKLNNSMWLNDFFSDPKKSTVYNLTRQFYDPDLLFEIGQETWIMRYLENYPAADALQILYYEQNSSYDTHLDRAFLTYLYWTHKEPKKFEGGDLVLEEDSRVEYRKNRLVIFPSPTKHRVTSVKMTERSEGHGRYCISNFVHLNTLADF
tara:strand:+ start:266 stop:889 length:624 start_codon:yes stop_codon:yes gene_type:complete